MKLYAKQKSFSIHRKTVIKDENDLDLYEISDEFPSSITKKIIADMKGNIIIYIKEKYYLTMPKYDVYINNQLAFEIKKTSLPLKNNFMLSNGYKAIGDFRMMEFVIYDDKNNKIGGIKRYSSFIRIGGSEKYELDIIDLTKKEIVLAIFATVYDKK